MGGACCFGKFNNHGLILLLCRFEWWPPTSTHTHTHTHTLIYTRLFTKNWPLWVTFCTTGTIIQNKIPIYALFMKYSVDFIRQFCDCKWRLMQIIILIIIVVNSTVPYLTNKGEHIVLCFTRSTKMTFLWNLKNYINVRNMPHTAHPHIYEWTHKRNGGGGGGGGGAKKAKKKKGWK